MTTFPEVTTRQQISTIRSHFHRNLSSFNMPEVSRFIRKCRGKDQTARSNRHIDKNFPAFMPAILAEKSHSQLLSSAVPIRKFRREPNDFSPSFIQVIAFVEQRSFFKIIRWKGSCTSTWCASCWYYISHYRFFLIAGTASDHKEGEMRKKK